MRAKTTLLDVVMVYSPQLGASSVAVGLVSGAALWPDFWGIVGVVMSFLTGITVIVTSVMRAVREEHRAGREEDRAAREHELHEAQLAVLRSTVERGETE